MQDQEIMEELCQAKLSHSAHDGMLQQVRSKMPEDDLLCDVAELFKVFGDSTRTKILAALFEHELSVCCISEIVNMSVSAVSHQLRILRQTKIVKSRRQGKEVYYSLDDEHIAKIYRMALDHLMEERNGSL